MSEERKAQLEAAQAIASKAVSDGETPLEYMLRVMRDPAADEKRRDTMAMGAASYLHPKLAAVEHSGNADKPLGIMITSGVPRSDEDEPTVVNGTGRTSSH
jgi:hypothetical protein